MNKYTEDAVRSICESVRFDSSLSDPLPDMPFGKGAADCLGHFLALAQSFGFCTNNYDNYVGEVIFGNGEKEFAVLAHLDVVPAGGGWTKVPFGGTVENGRIYGRGTMDDKGPAIACLYALKALKDEGFVPSMKIKLIVGCNEECGWACIEHYNKVAHMPEIGFSPDANFPVIYAEKGILHVKADFPVDSGLFASLSGGERVNMVCDRCEALPLSPVDGEKARALGLCVEDGKLVSIGKSAHGSTPEEGVNAILPVLTYFEDSADIRRIIDCLFRDVYGLKKMQDETGNLTLSPDVISYEKGVLSVLCDIRFPSTHKKEEVTALLSRFGVPVTEINYQAPLFNDKNGPLVSTLCEVYRKFSGKDEAPIAIGGGTYARALRCGAAFGPEIEGEEVTIHQADEYVTIERVSLMLDVYTEALRRLTK